jgi:hypothetical protein
MADFAVTAVVYLCVDAIELLHKAGKIATAGVDDQVVVVVHQAIGQYRCIETLRCLCDHIEESVAIFVIIKDGFAPVAARGNMINSAGKFDAEGSGHRAIVARKCDLGKRQGLTPVFTVFMEMQDGRRDPVFDVTPCLMPRV